MIASAFTCTGPYAVLIMLGIKRVENRSVMPVPSKGRCAVTCNKTFNAAEYTAFLQWALSNLSPEDFERLPSWGYVKDWPGKVIGCCDYEAHAAASSRPPYQNDAIGTIASTMWDDGYPFWWDLSEVICFDRPIPCHGNVGMWQMPSALAAQVSAADALAACVGGKVATAEDAERMFRLAIPLAGVNEGLFVLPLDAERRALSEPVLISLGDPTTTTVHPSDVFSCALKAGAKAIILAHKHPSGDSTPSIQDKAMTEALRKMGDALGVAVLDHFIIGHEGEMFSFRT